MTWERLQMKPIQCILQSDSSLCGMFAISNLLSFVSALLWALGELTAGLHHLKSLWNPGFCLHLANEKPWQGIESGRESMGHIASAPSNKVISWQWLNTHSLHPTDIFNRQSLPGSYCWSLLCLFKLREAENNLAIAVSSLVGFLNLALG